MRVNATATKSGYQDGGNNTPILSASLVNINIAITTATGPPPAQSEIWGWGTTYNCTYVSDIELNNVTYSWTTGATSRSYLLRDSQLLTLRGGQFGCTVTGQANGVSYSASQTLTINQNAYVIAPNAYGLRESSSTLIGTQYNIVVSSIGAVTGVYLDVDGNCETTWPCNRQYFTRSGNSWALTFDRGVRLSSDYPFRIALESNEGQRGYGISVSSFNFLEKFQVVANVIGTCGCGSISPSGTQLYSKGANARYYIGADSGFIIESVTVDGVNVGANSIYNFTNISASHTLQVRFASPSP